MVMVGNSLQTGRASTPNPHSYFELLVDPDHSVATSFGLRSEKQADPGAASDHPAEKTLIFSK